MIRYTKIFVLSLVVLFFAVGCGTTRARQGAPVDSQSQITALQNEVQAKDQQIQDLQYQLDGQQQLTVSGSNSTSSGSSVIRVPGVTVKAVQKALVKKGLDPGAVDGRLGKKTKTAIKQFQKRNNLKADGIVGEKTWSLLS